MKVEAKLTGFEDLSRLLKQLPQKVEDKILQNATMAAAREGAKAIKAAAPSGLEQSPMSQKYGSLKKNIKAKPLKKLRREKGLRGARISTGAAFWGYFYEKGTRYQPARPYFDNAFENSASSMGEILRTKIAEGIEKMADTFKGKR